MPRLKATTSARPETPSGATIKGRSHITPYSPKERYPQRDRRKRIERFGFTSSSHCRSRRTRTPEKPYARASDGCAATDCRKHNSAYQTRMIQCHTCEPTQSHKQACGRWWHLQCVKLTVKEQPKDDESWLCPQCSQTEKHEEETTFRIRSGPFPSPMESAEPQGITIRGAGPELQRLTPSSLHSDDCGTLGLPGDHCRERCRTPHGQAQDFLSSVGEWRTKCGNSRRLRSPRLVIQGVDPSRTPWKTTDIELFSTIVPSPVSPAISPISQTNEALNNTFTKQLRDCGVRSSSESSHDLVYKESNSDLEIGDPYKSRAEKLQLEDKRIDERMGEIDDDVYQIAVHCSFSRPHQAKGPDLDAVKSKFEALAQQLEFVLNGPADKLAVSRMRTLDLNWSMEDSWRVFLAIIVHEWVFATWFPRYLLPGGDVQTFLCVGYEEAQNRGHGRTEFRNKQKEFWGDILVFYSEEESVREEIRRDASRFAADARSFLLVAGANQEHDELNKPRKDRSSGDEETRSQELQIKLEGLFQKALDLTLGIRLRNLTGTDVRFFWPRVNDPFDNVRMIIDGENLPRLKDDNALRVKFALFPGMERHQGGGGEITMPVAKARVVV